MVLTLFFKIHIYFFKMKRCCIYFICLVLFNSSCKDKTCINGRVLNEKTDAPIKGARLHISYEYQDHGSLLTGSETIVSDEEGNFAYSYFDISSIYFTYILKPGYVSKYGAGTRIQVGEENNIEIRMRPLDGILKLSIVNATATHDSIYLYIKNQCEYIQYINSGVSQLRKYPLQLPAGEIFREIFATCQDDWTYIEWTYQQPGVAAPMRDSLYITTGDTVFYRIEY